MLGRTRTLSPSSSDTLPPSWLVKTPKIFVPPVVDFPRVFPAARASNVVDVLAREKEREREERSRAACTYARGHIRFGYLPKFSIDQRDPRSVRLRECSHADCATRINITRTFSRFPPRFLPFFPPPFRSLRPLRSSPSHQFLRNASRDFLVVSSSGHSTEIHPNESSYRRESIREDSRAVSSRFTVNATVVGFRSARATESSLRGSARVITRPILCAHVCRTCETYANGNAECSRIARPGSLPGGKSREEVLRVSYAYVHA